MSAASIPRIATESIGRIKADDKRPNRSPLDRMPTRWIKFVLLACIICWATGAAQFVHELIEHADHDEVVLAAPADHSIPADGHHEHHDHDNCPTCQLLAHMSAERAAPPAPLCAHLPTFCIVPLTDWLAPVVNLHSFFPIRGPPTSADISI